MIDAARTYATSKPAALLSHMGTTMHNNVIQTTRLLSLLITVTGNFDAREGNGVVQFPIGSYLDTSRDLRNRKAEEKQIGAAEYPSLPDRNRSGQRSIPGCRYKDLEKGGLIKALWTSSNPVVHSEDSMRVIEALKKLDLLVVVDFFRTPTADIADYIIPPASWLERDEIADAQNYPISSLPGRRWSSQWGSVVMSTKCYSTSSTGWECLSLLGSGMQDPRRSLQSPAEEGRNHIRRIEEARNSLGPSR